MREIILECVYDLNVPTPHPLRVMWFINEEPITQLIGFKVLAIPSNVRGNYTCQLTNTAGSDIATTIISTCSSK